MQLEQQKLMLSANNGATASKLRQMSSELIAKLNGIGCKVTLIQVVVQVNAPPYSIPTKTLTLSLSGQKQLTQLAEKIADSPLKDALNRLANKK